MTQYVINIGALPNDGTGDPLRTAFNEVNLNFNQVFAAGPVGSNIQIANNTILTTNTNGNLVLAPNGVGKIQANADIVPSVNQARNLGSSTQKWNTVYSQYITVSGDATIAGNLSVAGNIIQVGNIVTDALTIQLANTASTANAANGAGITVGASDNIATILYNSTSNAWTTNIGVSAVGNISAPYFIGNGSQLTGLAASYGNANVATFLAEFGSNTISTTGNITTGDLQVNSTANIDILNVNSSGNTWTISGNTLTAPSNGNWTSDPATLDEYINSALDGYINLTSLYANANVASQLHLEHGLAQIIAVDGSQNIWEFDSTGNLTLPGNILGSGNILVAPDSANNSAYLDIYLTTGPDIHIAGNSENVIIGRDSGANINVRTDGNVTIQADSGTPYAWTFGTDGNLTIPGGMIINGNINTLGTQTALLQPTDDLPLSFIASGANGTVTSFWTDDFANLMTSNIAAIYTPLQNTQTVRIVTGTNGGNIAIYDFDKDGMFTAGAVCATGNVYASNVSASGNVTGAYILGNVAFANGIPATYGDANVANFMANYGANTISMTGAVTSGNVFVNGEVSTTGNIIGANVIGYSFYANGIISASGNIDAPAFHGNLFGNSTCNLTLTPDGHFAFNVGNIANVVYINDGGILVDGGAGGFISASGNISGANINATGLITGGNIHTGGKISAAGAIFGANAVISNILGANIISTVSLSAVGNIVGNRISSLGNVSAVGNITGGNITTSGTGGNITLTGGNITGANIVTANTFVSTAYNVVTAGNLFITSQYGLGTTGTILEQDGTLELVGNGTGGCVIVGWNSNYGNLSNVATIKFNEVGGGEGNVLVTTGNLADTSYNWNFDSTGNLGLPGGGIVYSNPYTPSGSPGNTITLQPAGSGIITDQRLLVYPTAADGDHIHIASGNLYQTELFLGSDDLYVKLANTGNVVINANDNIGNIAQWTFDSSGVLNVPGEGIINSINDTVTLRSLNTTTGNANSVYLGTSGGLGFLDQEIGGNWLEIFRSNTDPQIATPGNLFIRTDSTNTAPTWTFGANGNLNAPGNISAVGNVQAGNVKTAGLITATGNIVTAGNFVGNGAALTNVTVSVAGNIIGTQPNVTLVAGSYNYVFDNTGVLTLPAGGGNEGAEIDFTKSANSTLSGNSVVIDQYVDRIRFFESGGNVRGAYIDLTQAATGVGTLLNNRAGGIVNAGVDVTLGNLKARIPTSGNRSIQVSTVTGTYSVYGSAQYTAGGTIGGTNIVSGFAVSVTTTPAYLAAANNFATAGDAGQWIIMDTSAGLSWRISFIIGASFNNNMITIERLV